MMTSCFASFEKNNDPTIKTMHTYIVLKMLRIAESLVKDLKLKLATISELSPYVTISFSEPLSLSISYLSLTHSLTSPALFLA